MLDYLIQSIQHLIKYGLNASAIALIAVGLFRLKPVRRWMNPYLPPLLRDEDDMRRIEAKIDLLLGERGLTCADSLIATTKSSPPKSGKWSIWRWRASTTAPIAGHNTNSFMEASRMKTYLRKLGSRKFQSFLIITITNIAMLIGYILNVQDIQDKVNEWMPAINLVTQTISTLVYIAVEGKVDAAKGVVDYAASDITGE